MEETERRKDPGLETLKPAHGGLGLLEDVGESSSSFQTHASRPLLSASPSFSEVESGVELGNQQAAMPEHAQGDLEAQIQQGDEAPVTNELLDQRVFWVGMFLGIVGAGGVFVNEIEAWSSGTSSSLALVMALVGVLKLADCAVSDFQKVAMTCSPMCVVNDGIRGGLQVATGSFVTIRVLVATFKVSIFTGILGTLCIVVFILGCLSVYFDNQALIMWEQLETIFREREQRLEINAVLFVALLLLEMTYAMVYLHFGDQGLMTAFVITVLALNLLLFIACKVGIRGDEEKEALDTEMQAASSDHGDSSCAGSSFEGHVREGGTSPSDVAQRRAKLLERVALWVLIFLVMMGALIAAIVDPCSFITQIELPNFLVALRILPSFMRPDGVNSDVWLQAPNSTECLPDLDQLDDAAIEARRLYFVTFFLLLGLSTAAVGTLLLSPTRQKPNSGHGLTAQSMWALTLATDMAHLGLACKVVLRSSAYGRLSTSTGLAWEEWLLLLWGGHAWMLQQAMALSLLRPGATFSRLTFPRALVTAMLPSVSDWFDLVKNVMFAGLALGSSTTTGKAIGLVSLTLLAGERVYFFLVHESLHLKLRDSYLPVLALLPEGLEVEEAFQIWIRRAVRTLLYSFTTPWKRECLVARDFPQMLLAVPFACLTGGGQPLVEVLNIGSPLLQFFLAYKFRGPAALWAVDGILESWLLYFEAGEVSKANQQWLEVAFVSELSAGTVQACLKDLFSERDLEVRFWGLDGEGLSRKYGSKKGSRMPLDDTSARAIAFVVPHCPQLRSLDLSKNDVGDKGAEALATHLHEFPSLHSLDLRENSIGVKGCSELSSKLLKILSENGEAKNASSVKGHLATLNGEELHAWVRCFVGRTPFDKEGAEVLARALRLREVHSLELQGSTPANATKALLLDDTLADEIGETLKLTLDFEALRGLSLTFGNISARGVKCLAEALGLNQRLTKLDLSHNALRDTGAYELAVALKTYGGLTHLAVSHNSISHEGARHLAQALGTSPSLKSLRHLNLHANSLGSDGARALAEFVRVSPCIQTLDLRLNDIEEGGSSEMAKAVKQSLGSNIEMLQHLAMRESEQEVILWVLHFVGLQRWDSLGEVGAKLALAAIEGRLAFGFLRSHEHHEHSDACQSSEDERWTRHQLREAGAAELAAARALGQDHAKLFLDILDETDGMRCLKRVIAELWKKRLQDRDALFAAAVRALESSSSIQSLALTGAGKIAPFDAATTQTLVLEAVEMKKVSERLHSLSLEGMKIDNALASRLAEISPSLEELNLSGNKIHSAGACAWAKALTRSSCLKALNLAGNKIGSDGVKHLAQAMATSSSLQSLDLGGNRIGETGAKDLAAALVTDFRLQGLGPAEGDDMVKAGNIHSSLQNLVLPTNEVGDVGAGHLSQAVILSASLLSLVLEDNRIGDEGARLLAKALKVCGSLQELQLRNNKIGNDGANYLGDALTMSRSLTSLNLSTNNIGPDGAKGLADGLKVCETLRSLDLERQKAHIGDVGAKYLAHALATSSLQNLVLAWNEIGPEGGRRLAKALKESSLEKLDLNGNGLGEAGARDMAEAIKQSGSLKSFTLLQNQIGPIGARHLAEAVKRSIHLEHLFLGGNGICDFGARELALATMSSRLQGLYLLGNSIGPVGAKDLAEAALQCQSLEALFLHENQIGCEGASHLAKAVRESPSLHTLNLSSNQIGVPGAKDLAEAVKAPNSKLRNLNLKGNRIGDAGARAFATAVKESTTLRILDLQDNQIVTAGDTLADASMEIWSLESLVW